jgi:hypothetical protein
MSKEKDGYFGSIRSHSKDFNNTLTNEKNILKYFGIISMLRENNTKKIKTTRLTQAKEKIKL